MFDTALRGGYSLLFTVEGEEQHLSLKKETIIAEIATCSRGLPQKNLGYVGADFRTTFVLVHSYGSGNPHEIEVIEKKSGRVLFTGVYLDADEKREVLLYGDSRDEKHIVLYDARTGRREGFRGPDDGRCFNLFTCPIELVRVTDKRLVIRYPSAGGEKIKVYRRG